MQEALGADASTAPANVADVLAHDGVADTEPFHIDFASILSSGAEPGSSGPATYRIAEPAVSGLVEPPTAVPVQVSGDDDIAGTFASLVERGLEAPGARLAGLGKPDYAAMQDGQVIIVTGWLLDGAGGHTFRGSMDLSKMATIIPRLSQEEAEAAMRSPLQSPTTHLV